MTQTLRDHVHRLTRPHKTSIQHEDGTLEVGTVDSLIQQLREAHLDTSGKTGGTGNKAKVPIDVAATDLLHHIRQAALENYRKLVPTTGNLHFVEPEPLVRSWAAAATISAEETAHAERTLGGWVLTIEAMFNPQKQVPIPGTCPECTNAFSVTIGEDGITRHHALTAYPKPGNQSWAECTICGASWMGEQLHELAERMAC